MPLMKSDSLMYFLMKRYFRYLVRILYIVFHTSWGLGSNVNLFQSKHILVCNVYLITVKSWSDVKFLLMRCLTAAHVGSNTCEYVSELSSWSYYSITCIIAIKN